MKEDKQIAVNLLRDICIAEDLLDPKGMADKTAEEVYEGLQTSTPSLTDLHALTNKLPIQGDGQNALNSTADVEHFAATAAAGADKAIDHARNTVSGHMPYAEKLVDSAHVAVDGIGKGVERGTMDVGIQANSTISVDPDTLETANRLTDVAGNITDPNHVGNMTEEGVDRLLEALADRTGIYTKEDLFNATTEGAQQAAYAGGYSGTEGALNAALDKLYDLKEEAAILLLSGVVLWKGYKGRRASYKQCTDERRALSDAYNEFSAQVVIYRDIKKAAGGNTMVEALLQNRSVFNAQFAAYEPYPSRWKRLFYSPETSETMREHTRLLTRVAEGISYFNTNVLKDGKVNMPIHIEAIPSK